MLFFGYLANSLMWCSCHKKTVMCAPPDDCCCNNFSSPLKINDHFKDKVNWLCNQLVILSLCEYVLPYVFFRAPNVCVCVRVRVYVCVYDCITSAHDIY